jgi:hypothetical protein
MPASAARRLRGVSPGPNRRLLLGESSSQVDRPPGGPGPVVRRHEVGNHNRSAALRLSRRGAPRYVRRFGSAASGCRNRTSLAVGLHRRTALPSTTCASGRRRSSRSISPRLRVSFQARAMFPASETLVQPGANGSAAGPAQVADRVQLGVRVRSDHAYLRESLFPGPSGRRQRFRHTRIDSPST